MKLYYTAGACSTSCHIALEESGLKYEAIEVDWDDASNPVLAQVLKMNPLGTLPILITDEGKQLDQNIAIQIYVADKAKDKNLLPALGTIERAEAMNWHSFVCSDLHMSVGALFGLPGISKDPAVREPVKKYMLEKANKMLKYLDDKLAGKDYLMGKQFIPADGYAYVVTSWTQWLEIPLSPYKNISAWRKRVESRPAVAKVLKEEGLGE
jgi:glutathione S-transferase